MSNNSNNKNVLESLYDEAGDVSKTYADPNNTGKFSSTPVEGSLGLPEEPTKTGDGLAAATVTNQDGSTSQLEYSWDTKAKERADLSYQSSVLEAKANYLNNRQQIEAQGQQAQQQVDMASYAENQSADKVGWTGGYVLDSERQMNYLKETIKAQMYGQMELQKYGYDTSLAAARLAYDTNRYDLALEYYNTALSRAFSLAQITDYYVAPEVTEHLNQYKIASDILNGDAEGDKENAARIVQSVNDWFKDHGVSPAGVKTAAAIAREQAKEREDMQLRLSLREAQGLTNDHFGKDADVFMSVQDGEDSYNLEDGTVKTVNFSQMSGEEILKYINGDSTGTAREQYYSRLDQLSYQLELDFTEWCKKEKIVSEAGTVNNEFDMEEQLLKYMSEEGASKFLSETGKFNLEDPKVIEMITGWDEQIKLPNGKPYNILFVDKETYNKLYNEKLISNGKNPNANQTIPTDMPTKIATAVDMYDLNNMFNGDAAPMKQLLEDLSKDYGILNADKYDGVFGSSKDDSGNRVYDKFKGLNPDYYKDAKEKIDGILKEDNIKILKEAYDTYTEYNKYEIAALTDSEREILENFASYYEAYSKLEKTITYTERSKFMAKEDGIKELGDGDYEFTAQTASSIGDLYNDGYQFGDGVKTVLLGLGTAGVAILETGGNVIGWVGSWFK